MAKTLACQIAEALVVTGFTEVISKTRKYRTFHKVRQSGPVWIFVGRHGACRFAYTNASTKSTPVGQKWMDGLWKAANMKGLDDLVNGEP
jgi:hypothetical protein